MTPYPWPWEDCGEVFYGWAEPGVLRMDFSMPRRCNLPKDHRGSCDYSPVYPAGQFPRRERKYERRQRLIREKRSAALS